MALGKSHIFDPQHLQLENGEWVDVCVCVWGGTVSHLTGDDKVVYCMGGEATS